MRRSASLRCLGVSAEILLDSLPCVERQCLASQGKFALNGRGWHRLRRAILLVGFVVSALVLQGVALRAQAPTGAIAGLVTDQTGAVVPSAEVIVTNPETGLVRAVMTGAVGAYSVSSLLAGTYEVKVQMPGFKARQRLVTVITGSSTIIDFEMEVGAPAEVVQVETGASHIHYDSHKIDGVVTRQQIQNLPLNGRNFLQLAFLEPGVAVSAGRVSQHNAQFHVSLLGGEPSQTRLTVDGVNVVNAIEGGTQQNFSQEIIQEFQVSSVNFDLSTGITGVGAVNIVTRGGGNDFHGSGYFFFRDNNMAAHPELRRTVEAPFFARRQSGLYLGGPFKKDRAFFFFNLEHLNQETTVPFQPQGQEFSGLAGVFTSPYTGKQVSTRFDLRISPKHSLFLRYSHDGNNAYGTRDVNRPPSNWLRNVNWADTSMASLTSSLTPMFVSEARIAYTYWRNRNVHPTEKTCPGCIGIGLPEVRVLGTNVTLGNTFNAPQGRDLRRYSASQNLTWQKGTHRLRFGGEWEQQVGTGFWAFAEPAIVSVYSPGQVQTYNSDPRVPAAARISLPSFFNSVQDILQLPLAGFVAGVGDPSQPPLFQIENAKTNDRLHFYVQDTWRLRPRFTLNYGLAWSYESNLLNHDLAKPAYLAPVLGPGNLVPSRHSPRHYSPSLGFAWSVTNDNKTLIRTGAGIYYGTFEIYKRLVERSYLGPVGNGRIQFPGSGVPNPLSNVPSVPLGTPLSFTTGPTPFRLAHLIPILPAIREGIAQGIAAQARLAAGFTTVEIAKSATDLITTDYTTPYSEHFSIGVQRQMRSDFVVNADFAFRQFIHAPMDNVDYNLWDSLRGPVMPRCTSTQTADPRSLCSVGPISVHTSSARNHYKALLVKVDKRMSNRWQMQASYALGSKVGSNSNTNKLDWFDSWGPSGSRHILNISGEVDLPGRFQVSMISQISTSDPVNPTVAGVDFNGDGTNGDRLPGTTYNQFNRGLGKSDLVRLVAEFNQKFASPNNRTGRGQTIPQIVLPADFRFGDNFFSQDLRVSKIFQLTERSRFTVLGEFFNVFNVANLGGFSYNLAQTATFGQPSSRVDQAFGSGGPRAFQLGARFEF